MRIVRAQGGNSHGTATGARGSSRLAVSGEGNGNNPQRREDRSADGTSGDRGDERYANEGDQVMTTNKHREVRVGVLMGSDTDLPVMSEAGKVLDKFGIGYEMEVMSAHRTPVRAHEYATTAASRGLKVLIAAAGAAAHLAGVMAASTTLPVIGVPMGTSSLNGLDALLSTVQMPGGIPVATMAIDKAGAVNAAIFAAEILGLSDPAIARKLVEHKEELARSVTEKNARLQQQLAERQ
jgi:5-(carboxyamino)imidazole ribonucleotide mutase